MVIGMTLLYTLKPLDAVYNSALRLLLVMPIALIVVQCMRKWGGLLCL